MYALKFRNRWGARHQRIRPREDMGPAEMRQKVGSGGRKISFMLPGSGLDLRPESGAPFWGRTIRFVLGAGIRRSKTGFGLPAAPLGPPCPAGFRSLAMVQFRRLPGAAAEGTTPGQHGRDFGVFIPGGRQGHGPLQQEAAARRRWACAAGQPQAAADLLYTCGVHL